MEEVSRNNTVQIKFGDDVLVMGAVLDFLDDRIMVSISHGYLEAAKQLKELDSISVLIYTPMGIKSMESTVITPLNLKNCIIIEKTPIQQTAQRREFVRINNTFDFFITKANQRINCRCVNISAGGIAFKVLDKTVLNIEDDISIFFPSSLFERDIMTKATILKANNDCYVAKYKDLSSRDEDRIVKFVFKVMTKVVY